MSTEVRGFAREEAVEFHDVPGFVVLLDKDMNETVPRQDARISWKPLSGGAAYQVTSPHEFDLIGKSKAIYYLAAGRGDHLMFVSPVISAPITGGILTIR